MLQNFIATAPALAVAITAVAGAIIGALGTILKFLIDHKSEIQDAKELLAKGW